MPGSRDPSAIPDGVAWTQDRGSPHEFNSDAEASGAVADTGYDEYLIRVPTLTGAQASNGSWQLQISGDTNANYEYVDNADAVTNNVASVPLTPSVDPRWGIGGEFRVFTNSSIQVFAIGGIASGGEYGGTTVEWNNNNVTDLTSFTISHPNTSDVTGTVEVYHR
jgi:hypothetical protein